MIVRWSLAAVLTVAPGLYAWVRGRQMVARQGEPTLRMELVRHRGGLYAVLLICATAAGMLASSWALPPVALLLAMAGSFPSRRRLYGETWSFAAWAVQSVRLLVGILGPVFALASAPAAVLSLGDRWWIGGLVLTPALVLWVRNQPRFTTWALGARPLGEAALEERLAAIVDRSKTDDVKLYRAGHPGGVLANAVALTGPGQRRVVFGETLLGGLTSVETAAIFAHEIAHVEEHAPRWETGRMGRMSLVLPAAAALALPAMLRLAGVPLVTGGLVAGLVVIIGLAAVAVRRRKHEAECDLRALELGADPEALIGGLTKLHDLALIPRRFTPAMERSATHPSLVHRIQAIREKAGLEVSGGAAARADAVVGSADPGWYAIFGADGIDRVRVPEGTPTDIDALREAALETHADTYAGLVSLHLHGSARKTDLVGVSTAGTQWRIRLAPGEAAAAAEALDHVDVRLAPATHGNMQRARTSPVVVVVVRLLAVLLALLAVVGSLPRAAALLVCVAAIRIARGPLLAASLGMLATAALLLGVVPGWSASWWELEPHLVITGITGVVFAAMLGQTRAEPHGSRAGRIAALLCAVAMVLTAALPLVAGLRDGTLYGLHAAFRARPEAMIFGMGLVGALIATPSRWRRPPLLAGLLAVALLPGVLASTLFLRVATNDALRIDGAAAEIAVAEDVDPIAEVPIAGNAYDLRAGSGHDGVAWAVDYTDDGAVWQATAMEGAFGAVEVQLSDDGGVLVLAPLHPGVLRVSWLGDPASSSEMMDRDTVLVRTRADGTFRALGWDAVGRDLVHTTGSAARLGTDLSPTWLELPHPFPEGLGSGAALGPAGQGAVAWVAHRDRTMDTRFPELQVPLLAGADLYHVTAAGATRLATTHMDVTCDGPLDTSGEVVCAADDGDRTHLWTLAPGASTLAPRCSLPEGQSTLAFAGGDAVTVVAAHHSQWLVDLSGAGCRVTAYPVPEGCTYVARLLATRDRITLLAECEDHRLVRQLPLPAR